MLLRIISGQSADLIDKRVVISILPTPLVEGSNLTSRLNPLAMECIQFGVRFGDAGTIYMGGLNLEVRNVARLEVRGVHQRTRRSINAYILKRRDDKGRYIGVSGLEHNVHTQLLSILCIEAVATHRVAFALDNLLGLRRIKGVDVVLVEQVLILSKPRLQCRVIREVEGRGFAKAAGACISDLLLGKGIVDCPTHLSIIPGRHLGIETQLCGAWINPGSGRIFRPTND